MAKKHLKNQKAATKTIEAIMSKTTKIEKKTKSHLNKVTPILIKTNKIKGKETTLTFKSRPK